MTTQRLPYDIATEQEEYVDHVNRKPCRNRFGKRINKLDCPGCIHCHPFAAHKRQPPPRTCSRCVWSARGTILIRCLSHTYIAFGQFKFLTFDQVPLQYLDWLCDQPWIQPNSPFARRLLRYITHDPFPRLLKQLFEPTETQPYNWEAKLQRREYMPKEEPRPTPDLEPDERPLPTILPPNDVYDQWALNRRLPTTDDKNAKTLAALWQLTADTIVKLEQMTDPNDLLDLNLPRLNELCSKLPQVAAQVRDAYRQARQRLRTTKATPVGNAYRFNCFLPTTKAGKITRRGRQTTYAADILPQDWQPTPERTHV